MLDSLLSETPKVYEVIILALASLICGGIFGYLYSFFKKKEGYFKDMVISYTLFPFLITVACLAVTLLTASFEGDQLTARFARVAVALLSAVVVLRYRSEPRNFEDLTYLFFLTVFGLLLGIGYLYVGLVIFVLVVLTMYIFYAFKLPRPIERNLLLNITIPENLNFPDVFNDIFAEYTDSYKLIKVKSADLGSVFVISYEIILKKNVSSKEFLDKVRTRNSNLNISLTVNEFKVNK